MSFLLDTNVLVRLANHQDTLYSTTVRALAELHRRGESVHVTPQNLIEFRNVGTRLITLNGLGLSVSEIERQTVEFESAFPLLPDSPDIYPAWKSLVAAASVIGKQVHDARLVAVCHTYGVTHLLTFNTGHFTRFAKLGPGLMAVDPSAV